MLQAPRYLNPALGIESKNENIFSKIEVFVLTTKKRDTILNPGIKTKRIKLKLNHILLKGISKGPIVI